MGHSKTFFIPEAKGLTLLHMEATLIHEISNTFYTNL